MTTEAMIQLVVAVLGGGTIGALGKPIVDRLLNRGKEQRDEWRTELARLRDQIAVLETKVTHLQADVEAWKGRTDEWRGRYVTEQAENVKLHTELTVAREENERCTAALRRLRGAVKCQYWDNCPFITGQLQTEKETEDGTGDNS